MSLKGCEIWTFVRRLRSLTRGAILATARKPSLHSLNQMIASFNSLKITIPKYRGLILTQYCIVAFPYSHRNGSIVVFLSPTPFFQPNDPFVKYFYIIYIHLLDPSLHIFNLELYIYGNNSDTYILSIMKYLNFSVCSFHLCPKYS